uniref:Uncharacterized protein n=1 Tax=Poecilia mexicana TaxID=48701 RepID=A0A3B3WHZ2_9TELE
WSSMRKICWTSAFPNQVRAAMSPYLPWRNFLNSRERSPQDIGSRTEMATSAPVHQHQEDQEKKALRDEVMKLTELLENQQTEHEDMIAALYDQRIKTDKDRRDAIRRADQLKANLMAEKSKTKETEICLAKQMEETSRLQSALDKTERDLDEGRRQWELEKLDIAFSNICRASGV